MFDPRITLHAAGDASSSSAHFGDKVYDTVIPRNVRLAEAPSYGLPALTYDRQSQGRASVSGAGRGNAQARRHHSEGRQHDMAKLKGLGRGLDALLSGYESPAEKDELRQIPIDQLQRGKYQPRTHMNPEALEDLAASIRAQGVVQPIVARPLSGGNYEIVAGERRWRAAQMAGLEYIPAVVRKIPDEAAIAIALIENIQRENLNPVEEANAFTA